MIFTRPSFKTKEALKEAIKAGKIVRVYRDCCLSSINPNGHVVITGPTEHPTWSATVGLKNGKVIKVL